MTRILQHSLLFVLLSSSSLAFSQGTFQKLFPGLQNSMGDNAHVSSTGGITFATWTYDQFGTSGRDIMLISLNDQGDTVWTKAYGRPYNDHSFSMLGVSDGGYLIVGGTDTADGINAAQRLYLIRTDAFGDTLWTRAYRRSSYDYGLAAAECFDGGFVVVGHSSGGLYAIRIDAQGNLIWSRLQDLRFPPFFESWVTDASCVAQLVDHSLIVGGRFQSGPTLLAKLDPDGNVLWIRTIDYSDNEIPIRQIVAMPDGGWVMRFPVLVDGDYDCLLARFDALGNIIWSKVYDGGGDESLFSFIRTADAGFAVVGYTSEDIPAPGDMYFFKTDSSGQVQFSMSFGDSLVDTGHDIVEADDGGYFIVGWTRSFGWDTCAYVIKVDSADAGDCHLNYVTTTVTDVELVWQESELDSFPSNTIEYLGACSVKGGTTIMDLCSTGLGGEITGEENVRVFPNPAHDRFTVSVGASHTGSELSIFNAQGKRVYQTIVDRPDIVIDRSPYPSGIYLVKVTTVDGAAVQRIILD